MILLYMLTGVKFRGKIMKLKPLISSENVDSIFINNKYQDEAKPLTLNDTDIKFHQYNIEIVCYSNDKIKICFHSLDELIEFSKAYNIK